MATNQGVHPRPSKGRRLVAPGLVGALIVASFVTATPAMATPTCTSSGPGTYTATVCITSPATGATVSDLPTVTATVDVTAGGPGVRRMIFSLAGSYLITDFTAPFTFILPTTKFADGTRTLSVQALMRDGFTTAPTSISLTFSNGLTKPPVNHNTFTPRTGTPTNGDPFVLAAAGDGADGSLNADAVTSLIDSWDPNMLAYLGDVYEKGTSSEFYNWYGVGNVAYGRFRAITNPVIGNHEYTSNSAPGYFDYWDNVPNYYSVDVAGWHLIALNSTSQFNQTATTSAQYQWLAQDLAAHPNPCTVVEFHHPTVNVGPEGDTPRMDAIWQLMASKGVDIVLNGHDHDYQRWVPLGGDLQPDPSGITQFVVGSGGHGIQQFIRTDTRMAIGLDTSPTAFGALKLQLNQNGAAYGFVNTAGSLLDSGSVHCSGAPSDTTAPSTPSGLTATAVSGSGVDLTWSASTDDVGVTAYEVYRDGQLIATVPPTTAYSDVTTAASTTYSYEVDAVDAAGNRSGRGGPVSVTTQGAGQGFFNDGFESGLSKWTTAGNFSLEQSEVVSGSNGAQATSTGVASWAYHNLGADYTDLYYRAHVKVASTTGSVYVLKVRTGTGGSILGLYRNGSNGAIAYRNDVAGTSTSSSTALTLGTWHDLQVHLVIQGSGSTIEVWLDGAPVAALTKSDNLGTVPIGRLQLGDNSNNRTFTEFFDDVSAGTSFLSDGGGGQDTTAPSTPASVTATATSSTRVDVSWAASSDDTGVTGYGIYRDGSLAGTVDGSTTTYADTSLAAGTTYSYTVDAFDAAGNRSVESAPVQVTTPTGGSSQTFLPSADAFVASSKPSANSGSLTQLRADSTPTNSYIRFDVQGLSGAATQASLRICPINSNAAGVAVHDVADDTWGELTITYNNAPTYAPAVVASSGALTLGVCVSVDVTSLVAGNGPVSLALTSSSKSTASLSSREGASPPQLIVTG
jgi:chitodextrinase